jgi:hypothetical protein
MKAVKFTVGLLFILPVSMMLGSMLWTIDQTIEGLIKLRRGIVRNAERMVVWLERE